MSFIDKFGKFIDVEAAELRGRQDQEDAATAKFHQGQLDQLQAKDLAKQEAVMKRAETLNMAWIAANLLKAAGVTPDNWLGKERIYKETRFRKRLELVEEKEVFLAEGWEVLQWKHSRYASGMVHTLILTPDPAHGSSSHLTHFERSGGSSFDYKQGSPIADSFVAFPAMPLDDTDMRWPKKWADHNDNHSYIRRAGKYDSPGYLYVEEREHDDRRGYVDQYTLYNESGAEDRIQRALARLAASHDIKIPNTTPV